MLYDETTPTERSEMTTKKTQNPFKTLTEAVATAIVAVAVVPLFIIDAVISSN